MGKMRRGLVSGVWVLLLFVALFGAVLNVPVVRAGGTIYIRADGSIDPPTAPITTVDNVTYTFTDNITDSIVIERGDIIVDGKGHTLQGPWESSVVTKGLFLSDTNNVTVIGANINGFYYGIYLSGGSHTISRNNITSYGAGVYLSSSNNNTLSFNRIENGGYDGISVWYSNDNTITWNSINGNAGDAGIYLGGGYNNLLLDNELGNNGVGIVIAGSSGNTVSRNNISNNTREGFYTQYSDNNTLYENNITGNTYGVYCLSGTFIRLFKNKISHNTYGVLLVVVSDSVFLRNDLLNNTYQVQVTLGYANTWDAGYPSGGNYWSDYTGVDADGDGIGDVPYVIDENNRDRYPLMSPWPSDNELEVALKAPTRLRTGNSALIEATVINYGFSNETSVGLFLFINNTIVNSTTISMLESGSSYTINYLWTPTVESLFNVTAYAAPVSGEVLVANNGMTVFVNTRTPVHNLDIGIDYFTIQEAIDAPETLEGHTILVETGTYFENVVVNKNTLTLVGESRSTTVIDGGVTITARYVRISNFTIQHGANGVYVSYGGESYTTISDNNIINNSGWGVSLYSSYNTISGNNIVNNQQGIILMDSQYNNVIANNVTNNNENGIYVLRSSRNTLRGNIINGNKPNFYIWCGRELDKWTNNIDASNLVEDKPVYYWINNADEQVPLDAAYVALINSVNITVRNLNLKNNDAGVQLVYTRNSLITENNLANNDFGIYALSSSGNMISHNSMTENGDDIYGESIDNNIISDNNMSNAGYGIYLVASSSNIISGNNITNHRYLGFGISSGTNNKLYHNNFVNNTQHATSYTSNYWDDGYPSGGNYWSNYTGVDEKRGPNQDEIGSDGIGDTPYVISANNQDRYPLMAPWPSGPGLHDLQVTLKAPKRLLPASSTLLEATVHNNGFYNEEDVTLFLFINTTVVNSTTISVLEAGSSYTISYLWAPAIEGVYNVTAYTTSVLEEIYVANNYKTAFVTVGMPPVQNVNTGLYYETIQEAIDAPETLDGHTIKVEVGVYYEHLTVSKSLRIIGEHRIYTIIDGSKTGTFVVQITANNVVLSGFTIQNSNTAPTPAIVLYSSNNIISNNTIINNGWGIYAFSVSNNTIENNLITNNVYGINLEWVTTHTVKNNTITNHQQAGIYLRESRNNLFTNNTIENNKDGIVLASDSNYNKFYHNNFIDNTSQGFAADSDNNTWDNGYPSGGNYWSNYAGVDVKSGPNQNQPGSDGIGDTSHTFSGPNQDRYPLMNQMGSPQTPIALFAYAPEHPVKDQTVTFNATSSLDRDGEITSYEWNFGDGNITTTTDPIITHVYTASGTYTVNLAITDNDGLTHSTTKLITVTEDLIAPTTLHDYDDLWRTADFTITLTATDNLSGVAETYYRINDGPIQNVTANGQPLITTESANNKLEYWSVDNAGNEELPHNILTEIKLDKTYPNVETPSRTPDGDVLPGQSVKISVNITDAASQVKNVTLYYAINDGETWTDLPMNHAASNLYEATIPPQEAGTSVRFRIVAYDHAGNNRTLDGAEPYCVYQVVPEFPPSLTLPLFMTLILLAVIFYIRKHQTLQNHI